VTEQAIRVDSVTVAFGGLRALDGVSLAFARNSITGLIGPNGSGKSTLVNTMSGQLRATEGSVHFGDTDITRLRTDRIVKLGLARTYQIPRLPPQLTVEEIITVPLIYGRGTSHLLPGLDCAAAIATFCGLGRLQQARCENLSVTDMRRLEIARALACGPSVLLLDEVMAGLSHADSVGVMDLIRQAHAAGLTVVIIEHLMRVITSLCQQVVVLNNGRALATGTPETVLSDGAVREAYLGKGFRA
jgi:branched-chain amino acid transport system ATP-binding protein